MEPTTIIFIIGGILVVVLVIAGIFTIRSERSLVDERLEQIFDEEQFVSQDKKETATPIADWLNARVEKASFGERIAKELAQADLKVRPGEYVAAMVIASAFTGFVGWFYGGRSEVFAIIGGIVGLFIPRFYVKRQQGKRLVRFNDQLPDMLTLMVNGLRAGYSNMMALESISKEMPTPISDEFRRVVREMQLGIPMETALGNLLRRIPSEDLDFIITAMNIQREVGGNLAEILDIIAFTIRERIRIRREIQTLVAQVLYSGRILGLMPIILALVLWGINRSYMMQFFLPQNRLCGIPILATGLLMIGAGMYAMNRVADIEI